jgi:hypothetical protein
MVRNAAEQLRRIFGEQFSTEVACAELHGYLVDRLLMDGLVTFRLHSNDTAACMFADALDRALDQALVAVLTRHARWSASDFATAAPDRLTSVLAECIGKVRRGFRQPAGSLCPAAVSWEKAAGQAVAALFSRVILDRRLRDRVARLFRELFSDRLRLHEVGLLGRTADPVTGSVAEEYAEAAIDQIEGEIRCALDPKPNGPQAMCLEKLMQVVERIEADFAPASKIILPSASRTRADATRSG